MSKVNIVSRKRLEEITINAIEWAIEVGEQTTYDLIRGMGITSDELDAIGYDKENFSSLYDAIDVNMNKQYVNPDNGEHATICENNGKYIIYTDLNANEMSFDNLSDAKHELFIRGYEPQ